MTEKSNIELLADFITLVYHEARNVRHLVKDGSLDLSGLEKLISLPKNRDAAWGELQSFRVQAEKQQTANEACEVFAHRFGKTLGDLKNIYANSNWKHSKKYGGNAWESIAKDALSLAQAIEETLNQLR